MTAQSNNPLLSSTFRITYLLISIVLVAGASIFFLPDIGPGWFWHPTPFNRRFVGAVYLTELVTSIIMLRVNRWAPARLVLPGSIAFSTLVSLLSIIYFDRLDPEHALRPIWFILYFGSTLLFAYFRWEYRHWPPADARATPTAWRNYLTAQGIVLGLYGVAQLAAPSTASAFWPWPIDDFHGRFYSAVFITLAISSVVMQRIAARIEWFTLGAAQVTFGLFAIVGLVTVDLGLHRVDWLAPGTWLWVGAFAVMLVAGIRMLAWARRLA